MTEPSCGAPDLGNVLLTGGSGQLGQALRAELLNRAERVVVLSGEAPPDSVHSSETWIRWPYDEPSPPAIIDVPVDTVVHLGAQTSAYVARNDPKRDVASNVLRFVSLLQHVSADGRRPLVVLAGSATQAGSTARALEADTPESPETFYDVAKSVSAAYLEQFVREGLVSGVTLRFSNVYGGSPKLLADRGLIAVAMRRALLGEPLTLFRGVDGERDFLHVSDAANACLLALLRGRSLTQSRFWIGSGRSLRLSEALSVVSATASAISGVQSEVELVDPPSGLYPIEMRSVTINSDDFREQTGWVPRVSFEEGVYRLARVMFDAMRA